MYEGSKIKVYHHVFLNQDKTWIFILLDQLKYIEDSQLINHVDEYHINAVGDINQFDLLKNACNSYKNLILNFDHKDSTAETPTLKKLWIDSQNEDFFALYLHLKGLTTFENHFKNNNVEIFKNTFYWRKYCEWATIENWKICVDHLKEGKDIVGCNLNEATEEPGKAAPKHFSGNIWWAKSSYLRTLDDIENSNWWKLNKKDYFVDRLVAEMWPCSKGNNAFSINNPPKRLQAPYMGLYSETWLREYYETKS